MLGFILAWSVVCVGTPAFAQVAQGKNAAQPKAGISSPYDEDGARHIAETHGFYGIGRLKLDGAGVWRGTAIQFGRIVAIEIDRQGKFSGIEKRP
jgi:hypothetical protein